MEYHTDEPALAAWVERYGVFLAWLDDTGQTIAGLPDWAPSTPVHIVSTPGLYYLEQIGRQEYGRYQRRQARHGRWTRTIRRDDLEAMRRATVRDIDVAKMATWAATKGRNG